MTGPAKRQERASLREVAAAAGVALSSASRALSGHPDVSPKMRERVLEAAAELGYERNLLWTSLRAGSTATVGMILREVASPLLSEIALGAEVALQARGYSMLLSNARGNPELDVRHMRLLDQRRVDGMLVQPTDPRDAATAETLARLRVPFVAVDRDLPAELGGGAVLIDHSGGMTKAVSYLADLGHETIGLLSPARTTRAGYHMITTLEQVCAERGGVAHVAEVPLSADRVMAATDRLLALSPRPTALIAGSNQIAPGALMTLRQSGVRIRDELSLIAIDDLPLMPCIDPPITVVSKSPLQVGETAARLLADLIDGASPETIQSPTELIVRDSCGPPA